jgi:hypothetical protein
MAGLPAGIVDAAVQRLSKCRSRADLASGAGCPHWAGGSFRVPKVHRRQYHGRCRLSRAETDTRQSFQVSGRHLLSKPSSGDEEGMHGPSLTSKDAEHVRRHQPLIGRSIARLTIVAFLPPTALEYSISFCCCGWSSLSRLFAAVAHAGPNMFCVQCASSDYLEVDGSTGTTVCMQCGVVRPTPIWIPCLVTLRPGLGGECHRVGTHLWRGGFGCGHGHRILRRRWSKCGILPTETLLNFIQREPSRSGLGVGSLKNLVSKPWQTVSSTNPSLLHRRATRQADARLINWPTGWAWAMPSASLQPGSSPSP